jgi:hypothetical protein
LYQIQEQDRQLLADKHNTQADDPEVKRPQADGILCRQILSPYAKQVETQRTTMELLSQARARLGAQLENKLFRRREDVVYLIDRALQTSSVISVVTITV